MYLENQIIPLTYGDALPYTAFSHVRMAALVDFVKYSVSKIDLWRFAR